MKTKKTKKQELVPVVFFAATALTLQGDVELNDATEPIIADQPTPFVSDPDSLPWYESDRLFGRNQSMLDSGISPFLFWDSITAANVSGGRDSASNFTAQTYGGVDLDLGKLFGFQDTIAKVSFVDRTGGGISGDVGGIFDPMTINGGADGQITWLYQAWIEKTFSENWALKVGRTSMDEDFAESGLNRYSLSTSINGPIRSMMLQNPQIYSFPLGNWGARLKYTPNDEHKFQLGAYQINDNPFGNNLGGDNFDINSGDGVTVMGQYDWSPQVFGRKALFYAGFSASFYDFTNFDGTEDDSMFSFYGRAEAEVLDGLKLFGFASYNTQEESAIVPLQVSAGANWKGLFPGRENDHTVAFATYGKISDDYGQFVSNTDVDAELVFELGHRFQITPATYIQPSVQYIVNPGGGTNGDIDDAVVLGAWVGASF
ncbi:MAG: carbohydrate porin [Roseibacillus sp.]